MTSSTFTSAGRTRRSEQPLHVLQIRDALLTLRTVSTVTGLSAATIYRRIAALQFPQPVRLGKRCSRWKSGEVQSWLADPHAFTTEVAT